jgi:hypothetical protein
MYWDEDMSVFDVISQLERESQERALKTVQIVRLGANDAADKVTARKYTEK